MRQLKNNYVSGGSNFLSSFYNLYNSVLPFFRECVAMQDPYCAWDNTEQKCTAVGSPDWSAGKKRFIQSISQGEHKACGRPQTGTATIIHKYTS